VCRASVDVWSGRSPAGTGRRLRLLKDGGRDADIEAVGDSTPLRCLAILPALNEAATVASVIAEIRDADPRFEILVVDDGSTDGTRALAAAAGAHVVSLPFNLGIGAAVQAGFEYARRGGYDLAVQLDADGQHDPADLAALVAPVVAADVDIAVGTRFAGERHYRPSFARRLGIGVFARLVSTIVRQRVTDTTSGFRALNRRGIGLFAVDYPHDYPEVEATVLARRHGLRLVEVPVSMRYRTEGRSSITAARSVYYMVKVSLALMIGLFRRYPALETP
jgi:glycosyltransferase involved in cell wall biosynthesis